MGIEEKTVGSPRVWLNTPVEVIIRRYLGQMTAILLLEVFLMFSVFGFNIAHPGEDGKGAGDTDKKTDPTPEGSRTCRVVLDSFTLGNPLRGGCIDYNRVKSILRNNACDGARATSDERHWKDNGEWRSFARGTYV